MERNFQFESLEIFENYSNDSSGWNEETVDISGTLKRKIVRIAKNLRLLKIMEKVKHMNLFQRIVKFQEVLDTIGLRTKKL